MDNFDLLDFVPTHAIARDRKHAARVLSCRMRREQARPSPRR